MTHACVNTNFVTTVTNMSNNKWGMFEAGAGNSVRLLDWDPNSGGSVRQHNQRAHCNTCETKKHLAPLLSHPLYTHHRNLHKICMHASIPSCANHGPLLHTYSTTKKLDMRVEAPTTANRVSNTTRCSTTKDLQKQRLRERVSTHPSDVATQPTTINLWHEQHPKEERAYASV